MKLRIKINKKYTNVCVKIERQRQKQRDRDR